PSRSGRITCGLDARDARACDGAFGPSASSCRHSQPSSTTRPYARSRSPTRSGSIRSLITTPAVVCGTYTSSAEPLAPAAARRTCSVISSSCVRRSVVSVSSCTGAYPREPVSVEAPTTRELDAFRERADRFIADLDEETYLHYGGHKETFDVEEIYARYEDLTTLEAARSLEGAPTELWRFACEGYLGNLTREHQARVAQAEAALEATVDGETVPYRMLRIQLSNEPDRARRQRLEEARLQLLDEHLNPIYLDAARIDRDAVAALGQPNYYELYKHFRFRLDELADECRTVLDETDSLWGHEGDELF